MANKIISSISTAAHKLGFGVKKHSPEILVVTGIVGVVGAAVLACRATTKISKITEEKNEQLALIDKSSKTKSEEEYSIEDAKHDRVIVYAKTGVKLVKLYAPSIVLGAASIVCILASHNILKKREAAIAAAYAAVDKGFKEYRDRVIERFGEQVDKELKYGLKAQQIEEETVDEGSGKTKKSKKTINAADPDLGDSPYAMWFDRDTSSAYQNSEDYNRFFLNAQQQAATDKLRAVGWLSLSEVYDALGIPKTKMSQIVGWSTKTGDDFVDFGFEIIPVMKENGEYENKIKLDFNVMGNILDIIPTEGAKA